MPIHLYLSDRSENLFEKFAENFLQQWADPFHPPALVVPNQSLGKWLKLQLANRLSISANLQFFFIEELLWNILSRQYEKITSITPQHCSIDIITLMLFELVGSEPLMQSSPALKALRKYLGADEGEISAGKLVQLCIHLAHLFVEYEYNRPSSLDNTIEGLMDCWPNRPYFATHAANKNDPALANELWQRELYGLIFSENGLLKRFSQKCGVPYYTLAGLSRYLGMQNLQPSDHSICHMFGVCEISRFHRQLIQKLSLHMELYLYLLNPCAELWEDVEPPNKHRRRLDNKQKISTDTNSMLLQNNAQTWDKQPLAENESDNALLSLWGLAGKENISLWLQITDYDFDFLDGEENRKERAPSILGAVQHMIKRRLAQLDNDSRLPQDRSIQILMCPSLVREVETVYNSILSNLIEDPSLLLNDIRIVVSDIQTYRWAFSYVFERLDQKHNLHVPYTITQFGGQQSWFCNGVKQLMTLCKGCFSRREVFELIRNPLVAAAVSIDSDTITAWEHWCEQLNVFHGFDKAHRSIDEVEATEIHTWIHAIKRLLIGKIAQREIVFNQSEKTADIEGHYIPYEDIESGDEERLEKFITTIISLFDDLTVLRCKRLEKKWSEAVEYIVQLIDKWLAIDDEFAEEKCIKERFIKHLNELTKADFMTEVEGIPTDSFIELIVNITERSSIIKATCFTSGVSISSVSEAQPIASRITYFLGMTAADFPSPQVASSLDLRATKRCVGDVTPAMADRYRFLELLMCTREKLYLSYVSNDLRKNAELQPSSVLLELESFITESILPQNTQFKRVKIPLLAYDTQGFEEASYYDPPKNFHINNEIQAVFYRTAQHIEPHTVKGTALVQWLRQQVADKQDNKLSPITLKLLPPLWCRCSSEQHTKVRQISLNWLRSFLLNPLEHGLRRNLNLWNKDTEDISFAQDEPFVCPFPARWLLTNEYIKLCTKIIFSSCQKSNKLELYHNLFDSLYYEYAKRGEMPEGIYADIDKNAIFDSLYEYIRQLEALAQRYAKYSFYDNISLGQGVQEPSATRQLTFEPIKIEIDGETLTITGACNFVLMPAESNSSEAVAILLPIASKIRLKYLINPFLFYVAGLRCEQLRNFFGERDFEIIPVGLDNNGTVKVGQTRRYNFSSANLLSQSSKYLSRLLKCSLQTSDFDHLPFEAIEELWDSCAANINAESIYLWLQQQVEANNEALKHFEPLELFDAYVPADAEEKIRWRFMPFFQGTFE